MKFLLSWHLDPFEGSPAADQWPQEVDGDGFEVSVIETDLLEIQTVAEQLLLDCHQSYPMLSLSCF